MNYNDFKKLLNHNDIFFSDAKTRIAHWRFNNIFNNDNQQFGGNKNNQNYIINQFENKKNLFKIMINSLVYYNKNRINYIIDSEL
jgi:hypothetical protein